MFLALHLSVKPQLPWFILDDPVQSMDEVHIAQFAALLRTLSAATKCKTQRPREPGISPYVGSDEMLALADVQEQRLVSFRIPVMQSTLPALFNVLRARQDSVASRR